ncbi:MAG TPA: ferritin-like domain-containing protein, partial [Bryobacteraceae bacterium]|nr:ferritin-like domain-containing protein [Bryobacteraceae bacterium]
TLDDLFQMELRELYDEEQRLVKALPKMAAGASSARLREALEEHLEQTKDHVSRLEECFGDLRTKAETELASGMQGLIQEGERVIHTIEQSPLRDAALIGAAQRVEHYEMAAYGGAISFARLLGHEKIARLLEQTLAEERAAGARLAEIAQGTVNQEALQLGAHQRG